MAIENSYHIYNSFIKVYYFISPLVMSLFHLAPPKLPGNFAMFSSLSVGESLSNNNTIYVIGRTNSHCSAPIASPSLSLIVWKSRVDPEMSRLCGHWPIISIIVNFQKNNVSLLKVYSFPYA